MQIPTEPIGSLPRPSELIQAWADRQSGQITSEQFDQIADEALRDTLHRFAQTGSPIITDGEQAKSSFATYPLDGATNLGPGGVVIPFEDGHTRQLPTLTAGPFRYATYASKYLSKARTLTQLPLKQAVISVSAISLLYPADGLAEYPRETFLDDLVAEGVTDIRQCFEQGAEVVQIDFTEGRLSLKLDPSGGLLDSFVDLNNRVLSHFSEDERRRIGVHTCPGGDCDSTHSADVDYADLLPALLRMKAGRFYLQMSSEKNADRVLSQVATLIRSDQLVFVGVTDPINPVLETPEQVRERVLQAARHIPLSQLGTTDDCGFSPFADDASTSRDIAFAKIRARVQGTRLASEQLALAVQS